MRCKDSKKVEGSEKLKVESEALRYVGSLANRPPLALLHRIAKQT